MKWEEEQALLAAAAAASGQLLDPAAGGSFSVQDDQTGELSDEEDSDVSEPPTLTAQLPLSSWDSCASNRSSNEDAGAQAIPTTLEEEPDEVLDFSLNHQRVYSGNSSGSDQQSITSTVRSNVECPLDLSVPKRFIAAEEQSEAKRFQRFHQSRPTTNEFCDSKQPTSPKNGFLSPWDKRISVPYSASGTLTSNLSSLISLKNSAQQEELPPSSQKLPPYTKSPSPGDTSKALERIQELAKLNPDSNDVLRSLGTRNNVWQNQWMNRGAEQTRDVLKCVWCQLSFESLTELTKHMREAKHPPLSTSSASSITPMASSSTSSENSSSLKETMQLPRKLVRGQDVWLGKGAEQTRQILKCMWCGQSFKNLDEMTVHMQKTQHYTNIISQEQIISWKSPDNKTPTQSHVNAVLTCKVCDQAFASLKELSAHMVKYSHYKEHIMRSISETGGRRRQTREKRKKSLPVRKLLELERAHNEMKSESNSKEESRLISCEKCGERIESLQIANHVRFCSGKISSKFSGESVRSTDSARSSLSSGSERSSAEEPSRTDHRSALSALEKLIETSLNPGQRNTTPSSYSHTNTSARNLLSVDNAANRSSATSPGDHLHSFPIRPRSRESVGSTSCAESRQEDEAMRLNPDSEFMDRLTPLRAAPENGVSDLSADTGDICVKRESSERFSCSGSPGGSERAATPRSDRISDCSTPAAEELPGGPPALGPANPLAALQKLCDKTDTPTPRSSANLNPQDTPGAILAFSWACNDAVMTDSIMKCAFCDTPFISKGAYRHHLSKVHFVKDGMVPESNSSVNGKLAANSKPRAMSPHSSSNSSVDDTPHSKFLKYSELAKQLSSKYLVE